MTSPPFLPQRFSPLSGSPILRLETTVLMNKAKGTVSHYRKGLVVSMFGDKDTEDLDRLIRLI